MIAVFEFLICIVIFMQTVVSPITVLFRKASKRLSIPKAIKSNTEKFIIPALLLGLCFTVFFVKGSLGFLFVGLQVLIVVLVKYILKDYPSMEGDERDFELTLRARSAALFVALGIAMLYFIAFPATLDAFTVIAGVRLVQYILEVSFVYSLNAAQNQELEAEEA